MKERRIRRITVFFICMLLLLLSGCDSSESRAVRKTVEESLNQLTSSQTESVQACIGTNGLLPGVETSQELTENLADIFTLFYKDFSYKIEKITVKENQAAAHTRLNAIDGKALAKDFAAASLKERIEQDSLTNPKEISVSDSYRLLKDLLTSKKYKTTPVTADIKLTKKEETWSVEHTEELDSLLTGNFLVYASDCDLLSPSEIVETHFNTIKGFDTQQLTVYLSLDELLNSGDSYDNSLIEAIAEQIHKSLDFKITGEEKEENSAIVRVSIESADFSAILEAYNKELSKWLQTSESLAVGADGRRQKEKELLLSSIASSKATLSHEVDLHLVNDGVNWKIQMNEEIAQAIFGDISDTIGSALDNGE